MLAVFIIYLSVLMVLTWYASRRSRSAESFMLGDKKISGLSLALSERATGESAWLILGLTGEAFLIGMQAIWIALGCVIGIIFIWFAMSNRLRVEAEKSGALTISSLMARRFPGAEKIIGILSSSIVVFFFTFYVAAQFYGGGAVLEQTFGLSPIWGIIIGSLVVTFYCMIGGFIAVVFTDVFQAILMIISLIVLPAIILFIAASNDIHIAETINQASDAWKSMTGGKTGIGAGLLIASGLSWALGYTGQPQLLTRMMEVKNKKDIVTAKWVATIWTVIAYAGALVIGYMGYVLLANGFVTHPDAAPMMTGVNDYYSGQTLSPEHKAAITGLSEKIFPLLVNFFVMPVIAGILLSGAISAMMSTASSEIVVSSSSISEDIYGNLSKKKMSPKRFLNFNKILTLCVGVLAFGLALMAKDSVYGLVSYAWAGIGSSFGPALLLILYWKKISRAGVIASLLCGTISTIIWKEFFLASTGISERLTSFVFAFVMAVLFSLILPEKKKC
ncbi:MAG: sodium/proline symporter [Bacteroidota bacterium]